MVREHRVCFIVGQSAVYLLKDCASTGTYGIVDELAIHALFYWVHLVLGSTFNEGSVTVKCCTFKAFHLLFGWFAVVILKCTKCALLFYLERPKSIILMGKMWIHHTMTKH